MPDNSADSDQPIQRERRLAGMSVRHLLVGTLVATIAAIAAGAIFLLSVSTDDNASPVLNLSSGAASDSPDGEVPDALGRPIALDFVTFDAESKNTASYLGQPLVLNFFAEWCAPCRAEMPAFEEVYQDLGGQVAFLGLSLQETVQEGCEVIDSTGVTYNVGRDTDGSAFAALDGFAMPTTAFIDAQGTVVEIHSGALTATQLRDLIDEHLL